MTVLTVVVAVLATGFVLLLVREQRAWRRYRRASEQLVTTNKKARRTEIVQRANTQTNGGFKMRSEDTSRSGRAA